MPFEVVTIGDCTLYRGDCRDVLPTLEEANLVLADPPYFKVLSDAWDNQWKTETHFIDWANDIARILATKVSDNGSLYWFCSSEMAARIELTLSQYFNVLNNIVWSKGSSRKGVAGTGIDITALRKFWPASSERIVFCEHQFNDPNIYKESSFQKQDLITKSNLFGSLIKEALKDTNTPQKELARLFPSKTGGLTGCASNWIMGYNIPTKEQYEKMQRFFGPNYLRREYEDLRREYEDLRREYEDLRRPFFAANLKNWSDVWDYPIERGQVHPAQKPIQLVVDMVAVSSRHGDTVIDPFMGSGTTGVAAVKLGRKFTGIELESEYFDIACRRIEEAYHSMSLFGVCEAKQGKPEQASLMEPRGGV